MVEEVLCYNRGCGKTFIPGEDEDKEYKEGEGPCRYHPGAPFFHDAYKGWTCCNKKATDFTEFLNFPGCTQGQHSNVKPIEPEKITGNLSKVEDEPPQEEVRKPLSSLPSMKRPAFDTPMTRVKAVVAKSLRDQLNLNPLKEAVVDLDKSENSVQDEIKIGETCKNAGCKATYDGSRSNEETCEYHPGVPIFHEGLKFWSCCQRRTTDFQSFLNQAGCERDKHCWLKKVTGVEKDVKCRYDWHQTGSKVTVAIYAKKYDPDSSFIEVNPIRLKASLVFPEQGGNFDLDLELKGIIAVDKTTVNMMGSKVEIHMTKAEPGSWSALNVARQRANITNGDAQNIDTTNEPSPTSKVDALDLDDITVSSSGYVLSPEAQTKLS